MDGWGAPSVRLRSSERSAHGCRWSAATLWENCLKAVLATNLVGTHRDPRDPV